MAQQSATTNGESGQPRLTLIENAEIHAPEPQGRGSILLANDSILRTGRVDRAAVEALGDVDVLDAAGCVVVPGFIDPHQHLLGGSGEQGFSTQTPEFFVDEIVRWGITTVVGCLGVDTTMKTMPGLLAKAKALREEGITAYLWSGGYDVPPQSIMESVRHDILFIDEVIGAGEIAISDVRATDPDPRELAKLVSDAYVGGQLSRKAGLTHFHVGEGKRLMRCLHEVLDKDRFQVEAASLYATHIERSEALMDDAIALVHQGIAVDIDVSEGELHRWLRYYREHGGPPARLTISSDAGKSSPRNIYEELCGLVVKHGMPLEDVLPHVTSNTADILRLDRKGRIRPGADADIVILERGSLALTHVFANGRRVVDDGCTVVQPSFTEDSDRVIRLTGADA
jgi:beta-aspartyl-dipeptidase (metallo-type)